jgi:hypothetical protein
MIRRIAARLRESAERQWHRLGSLPMVRDWRARQLRRLQPLAGGRPRGTPVIRHYWERFLDAHRPDVRGHALEIGSTQTLTRIGGRAVLQADALDLAARDGITVVADLSRADALAGGTYDCVVIPFTTHLIYDIDAAMYHALRILKTGGTLLVNFPCVDACFPRGLDMGTGTPLFVHWFFTPLQVENLLRRLALTPTDYTLAVDGNLFARVAYQMNMPAEELTAEELAFADEGHPLLVSARVVKPEDWRGTRPDYRDPWVPDTRPDRWNDVTGHYPRR